MSMICSTLTWYLGKDAESKPKAPVEDDFLSLFGGPSSGGGAGESMKT